MRCTVNQNRSRVKIDRSQLVTAQSLSPCYIECVERTKAFLGKVIEMFTIEVYKNEALYSRDDAAKVFNKSYNSLVNALNCWTDLLLVYKGAENNIDGACLYDVNFKLSDTIIQHRCFVLP